MKRVHVVVLLPVVVLALLGCISRQAAVPSTATAPVAPVDQDLKPASELALLMRTMAVHADSVKASVNRGDKKLPPYPKEISTLLTAIPTDGMHIDPITFPTFGKDYQDKVDALYKAAKKDRKQAYNALVQSCANCHGTHCPGPLMRIRKMYVKLD
jgi:cytochrome c553